MIVLIEQFLPHYREELYKQISDRLDTNFTLYYGVNSKGVLYPKPNTFKSKIIKNIWLRGGLMQFFFRALFSEKKLELVIVRGAPRNFSLYILVIICKLLFVPIVFWGQGYSRKRVFSPRSNVSDRISLWFYKLPKAIITYTSDIKNNLIEKGIQKPVYVAVNTIDEKPVNLNYNEYKGVGKESLRRSHNINTKYVLIFVGRLQRRKRLDYLIEVFSLLQKTRDPENNLYSLLIVGEGEERSRLEKIVQDKKIKNITFTGELYKDKVDELIFLSDIFLMPGWVGLGVNHSFMLGTPIISELENNSYVNHAPEIEFIKPGYNGLLVDKGDKEKFVESIEAIIADLGLYSSNAKKTAENELSMKRMVDPVIECVNKFKKQ